MKVIVFDLDNTLCALAKPVLPHNADKLKILAQKGHKIVICSGKPTYYLCGFARQLGIDDVILVGENGGVIQFGVDLPPKQYYIVTKQKDTVDKLRNLRMSVAQKFGDKVWFQPNEIALTPFPREQNSYRDVGEYIYSHNLDDCIVYDQGDCFDVLPRDVNKSNGLAYLSELLGVDKSDFVSVGDSANDYPMFDFAGTSLGINLKDKAKANFNFDKIDDALDWLLDI